MTRARCLLVGVTTLVCLAGRSGRTQVSDGGVEEDSGVAPVYGCDNEAMVGADPLYVVGPTIFKPAVAALAAQLSGTTGADHATIIYVGSRVTCDGVDFITHGTQLTGRASFWSVNGNASKETACDLPQGAHADVGISDLFYETCAGARPSTIADVTGPVQATVFIVPRASETFAAIAAEEAQLVFGCGMAGKVSPYGDPNGVMYPALGALSITGKYIQVPPDAFKGRMNLTAIDLVNALNAYATSNPDKAIGFLPADAYDSARGSVKALAFRGFDQTLAFHADSGPDKVDRRNVRDGHYLPWAFMHSIVEIGGDGKPTKAKAARWLGWIDGTIKLPGFVVEQALAKLGIVPQCAMKVTRTSDGGLLARRTPADPCGCYFDSVVTKVAAPPGCTPCATDTGCTGGKRCHHRFCE